MEDIDTLKARRTEILFAMAAGIENETDAHELERIEAGIREQDEEEAAEWDALQ